MLQLWRRIITKQRKIRGVRAIASTAPADTNGPSGKCGAGIPPRRIGPGGGRRSSEG